MASDKEEFIAVHLNPIWRDQSNFIFQAQIKNEKSNGKYEWEQLWGKQIAPYRFVVCCIPFFIYNLDLGEEVETNENYIFRKVIRRSGQTTFRVWFDSLDAKTRLGLFNELDGLDVLMELYSEKLLAISVRDADAQKVADYLQSKEGNSLIQYETGHV
jgi:hypothetical protein